MHPISHRAKRPSEVEPSNMCASATDGCSMANKRACLDSVAGPETWSSGEEDAQSEALSVETDSPAVAKLDWSDTAPAEPQTIKVRIPRRTWAWLQTWTLKDVKKMRPCDKQWKKEDQRQLLANLKRVLAQPTRVDGDWIYVTEQYAPAKNGFPGRLMSSGLQGLQGQIRANLLAGTADIDMSACMHRILLWVCKEFKIATPNLAYYVNNRDAMLQRVMEAANITKCKAKELFTMAFTSGNPISVSSPDFKKLDKEAKEVQHQLMQVRELQWIKPFGKEDNVRGSFIAHLFQWVECKLVLPVSRAVSAKFNTTIAALVFDGFNVADASLHGNEEVLSFAHAMCEQICPGIDMHWAWKELDFMVKSKDTRQPLQELRVPASFVAPAIGSPEAAALEEEAALGPEEYTYKQQRDRFSLGLSGSYGKVGSTYIKVEDDGNLTLAGDAKRFKEQHKHEKFWELKEKKDPETGVTTKTKVKYSFIDHWMQDEQMDPKYLPVEDKDKRYYWDRFDMIPPPSKCPAEVYNLWAGFAAESMETDLNEPAVRDGLTRLLEHFKMLCSGKAEPYNFLLNLLAHALQHPDKKVGVVICLVGKQGCGKGTVWEIIERLVGDRGCFSTKKPDRDVFGHFNGRMKDAFFVRMAECDKKKLADEALKDVITGHKIDVHEKYCPVVEVKSYARFFIDTNSVDAIPDEHGERRYFIIKCNEAMVGHNEDYFTPLREVLADDRVIRVLYDFLKARSIQPTYHGKDIPVGEYARALKDSKRSEAEQFLEWVVEQEPLGVKTLHLTAEAFATRYKAFKGGGEERCTDGIMKQLKLLSIEGVEQYRNVPKRLPWCQTSLNPVKCSFCTTFTISDLDNNKVMRQYVVDCKSLRTRYGIEEAEGPSAAPAAEQPVTIVDCQTEVERFWRDCCETATAENQPPEESPDEQMWDDGMEEDEAFNRELEVERELQMQREGNGNDQELQHAAAAAAASPPTQAISKGKQRARPSTTPTACVTASVALIHKGRVLLTRETRNGKSLLNLPGGKGEAGETLGQTAAREAHEETGKQLTARTRTAITAIANWVKCGANQGHAGALTLDDDDPDGTVDTRFDRTAANAQHGSKTAHEGLEWHALADVHSDAWRREHMHFPGQHRAAGAMRALDQVGAGPSSTAGGMAAEEQ